MKLLIEKGYMESNVVIEDYFPLRIEFGKNPDLMRHNEIVKFDTDLIEFAGDFETGDLLLIALILCNHYAFKNEILRTPKGTPAKVRIDESSETEVDFFEMSIYIDGVHITFSDHKSGTYIECGNVVFGVSDKDEILELFVKNMRCEEIVHLQEELTAYQSDPLRSTE